MTYASDLGLKVGSKVKVIGLGNSHACFSVGDTIELVKDDGTLSPWFKRIGDSLDHSPFSICTHTWEHYKEEEKDMTSVTKIKFPCCVPTSEIKDAKTLSALVALFEANGATVYDGVDSGGGHEFDRVDSWDYFGVSLRAGSETFRTDFYDDLEDYDQSDNPSKIAVYSLAELLGLVAKEDVIVTPVVTEVPVTPLLPVGAEVQIAKDSEYYVDGSFINPIKIKGTLLRNEPLYSDDEYLYRVEWSNGSTNSYKLKDLVLWNEGWFDWNGGECPVAKGIVIDVKFRDGDSTVGISANMYYWEDGYYNLHGDDNDRMATHWDIDGSGGDIVAYRLHVPTATPSVASQEAITERLEGSPIVGIDCSVMGTTASTEPLITITQEVKYTVVIKGTTFTFTQDELDALAEELLGFTTL